MNLITFKEPISLGFRKSAGGAAITFEADRPYLIANSQLDLIMKEQGVQTSYDRVSRIDIRITNFHVGAFKAGTKVLLFNGSGGYGDQILTWPVARILASHYGFQVHAMAEPGNHVCWWGFPWIKSVQAIPCAWEQVKLFDAFVVFDAVVNTDEHADQEHPVDAMLRKVGIDPASVSPTDKVVRPVLTHGEMGSLLPLRQQHSRLGLYQLAPSSPVRALPPSDSVSLAIKLAEATPDIHWLCLYDEYVPKEYKETLEAEAAERKLSNLQAFTAPNLRELWALTEHVNIVVAPDSMMVHVAGCFGTPCVGLWGPMDPGRRVRYYEGHHSIWHKEFCPKAPCFAYTPTFPRHCPPRPDTRKSCDVVAGITSAEVIDAVRSVAR